MGIFVQLLLSVLALGVLVQGQHALTSESQVGARRGARGTPDVNWNDVIDNMIVQFREQLREQGKDVVPLPDINESFERRFVITVRGKFMAVGGHMKSMTSVHRVGNVTVSESLPLIISTLLSFDTLLVHYDHFTARVLGLNPSGELNATLAQNAFLLKVRIDADGRGCRIAYEDVQVMELGGVEVNIKGLSVLNKLASVIGNRVAKKMRQSIAVSLENLLHSELEDTFKNTVLDCS